MEALRDADVDVVRLDEADLPRLSHFCRDCSAFFELVEGKPGGDATAAEILGPLPPEYARGTAHVFGFERNEELIGVAELLQGYPSEREWFIGLLLLRPEQRRGGLGTRLCTNLLEWIRAEGGSAVRLVVQHQNPLARAFWERQGFSVESEDGSRWILLRAVSNHMR